MGNPNEETLEDDSLTNESDGFTVGWGEATMDVSKWWRVESILPLDAAMLLSRRNPNNESRSSAESSTSDELGPDDFKMLLNGFEGAPPGRRTLEDWANYAAERGFKIHSWLGRWEAAKRRIAPEFFADEQQTTLASECDEFTAEPEKKEQKLDPWMVRAREHADNIWLRMLGANKKPSKEGIASEIAGRLHRDDHLVTKTGNASMLITLSYARIWCMREI